LGATGAVLLDLDEAGVSAAVGRLHDELGAGVSARLPWLQAWRESHPAWDSWVLALQDGAGEIRAIAPLARRRRTGRIEVQTIGHPGDRCPVVYRSAGDADELAAEVASALRRSLRPWRLYLPQLPAGCPFATGLVRRLRTVRIEDGALRPIVMLGGCPELRTVLSRNLERAESKARNRIARAGVRLDQTWLAGSEVEASLLEEIRRVHRARDIQLRGFSALDDRVEGGFYDSLIRRHLDHLDVLEIRLDRELGAYLIWIRNGGVRAVLDNRVSPRWTEFSAGLIANNVALRAAAGDPDVGILDWGAGVQRYKLQSANKVIPHQQLIAWSTSLHQRAGTARRAVARGAVAIGLARRRRHL
jgi:hypothetical protein